MHIRDVCTPAQLGHQVLDPARRVRPALAAENGADSVIGGRRLNRLQRLTHLGVQRQATTLVALADNIDPARADLQVNALPAQRDELVDAQSGVEQQCHDRVGHRAVILGLADEPSALHVAEPFGASGWVATSVRCTAGFLTTRSVSVAQA